MAKLRLKTVQNGAEGGNPNLISQGNYLINDSGQIVDNSGNVIDDSGILIDSGSLVGIVHVEGGTQHLEIPAAHCTFYMDVTWQSGDIEFHQPEENDVNKENNTIPSEITLEYEEPTFSNPPQGTIVINTTTVHWVGFLGVSVVIEYVYIYKDIIEYSSALGGFTVPHTST